MRAKPGRGGFQQRLVVVENARHRGRAAMAVQVHRALQQFGNLGVAVRSLTVSDISVSPLASFGIG